MHAQGPRRIGSGYVIEDEARDRLGRGALGTVFRGCSADGGQHVAIKILDESRLTDPEVVTRFVREREALIRLRHPNLVPVLDLVVEGNLLAVVMELVEGGDLRLRLDTAGPLPPSQACALVAGLLRGLGHAHQQGVVHRDVKPENVLVEPDGSRLRLVDFGIAKLAHGQSLTRMTALIGTPDYMAPELAESIHASAASDLYSSGVLLYEVLTGVRPFSAATPVAVLRKHLDEAPPRPPDMPEQLWRVVAALLEKQPTARPAPAEAVAAVLDQLAGELAGLAPLSALLSARAAAIPAQPLQTAAGAVLAADGASRLLSAPHEQWQPAPSPAAHPSFPSGQPHPTASPVTGHPSFPGGQPPTSFPSGVAASYPPGPATSYPPGPGASYPPGPGSSYPPGPGASYPPGAHPSYPPAAGSWPDGLVSRNETVVGSRPAALVVDEPTVVAGRSRPRWLVPAAAGLVALLLAGAAVAMTRGGGGASAVANGTPLTHAFATEVVGDGVTLDRTWVLELDDWHRLTATLVVTNTTARRAVGAIDEVIPKEVAQRAADIDYGRAPSAVVQDDPVIRWTYDLAPRATMKWRYGADVPESRAADEAQKRLDGLVTKQRGAVNDYRRVVADTRSNSVVRLRLAPATMRLQEGQTQFLALSARMLSGRLASPQDLASVTYTTTTPGVVFTSGGAVTALAVGTTQVVAHVGSAKAVAVVTVVPRPAGAPVAAVIEAPTAPGMVSARTLPRPAATGSAPKPAPRQPTTAPTKPRATRSPSPAPRRTTPAPRPTTAAPAPQEPANGTVVVDNGRSGFSQSGPWQTIGGYGGSALATTTAPRGCATAKAAGAAWAASLPQEGFYDVEVYLPSASRGAPSATYAVSTRNGTTSVTIDQRASGWRRIASNAPLSSGRVTLSNDVVGGCDAATSMTADAIRFVFKFS